jgi:hypothetical protein
LKRSGKLAIKVAVDAAALHCMRETAQIEYKGIAIELASALA